MCCCCSVAPPVFAEAGLWESFIMSIKSCSELLWVRMSLISSDSGRKARPVAEAQPRQEWRDGRYSFPKIFLFCKYLTWIIRIRTYWQGAGFCFYSHLFRESTENTLQHSRSGPKRRKNGSFLGKGGCAWSLGCEELSVAGWLASRHRICTWVPRACLLTMHKRNHLPASVEQGARRGAQKPWPTGHALGLCIWPWTTHL